MKCPLMLIGRTVLPQDKGKDIADCLKEECAWWDEEMNCCSVKVIAKTASRYLYKRTGSSD